MDLPTLFEYQIEQIIYVVDGDTADMTIELGFDMTRKERFRFWGINCPERGDEPGYSLAKSYIQALKTRVDAGESTLFIRSFKDDRHDSFGRYLATLYEVCDGTVSCVNTTMVELGLAVVYRA